MQRGRGYPQILERYLNPDLPPTAHAPLQGRFAFAATWSGAPLLIDTGWVDVIIDGPGLGYYFIGNDSTDPAWEIQAFFYLNAPTAPGINADIRLFRPGSLLEMDVDFDVAGFHWTPSKVAGLLGPMNVDTVFGPWDFYTPFWNCWGRAYS